MPKAAEPFAIVRDRAVYFPEADTLVIADLHLGTAAASSVEAPLDEGGEIVERLGSLVDRFQPTEVVLAGDVLHAFGFVPRAARDSLAALTSRITEAGARPILLEGNHDVHLAAVADRQPAENHELDDGTVVCHGHKEPNRSSQRYVVGHDHPTIEIEGRRRACYLQARDVYEGSDVLALPAFNPALRGTPVNSWTDGDPLSPLLAAASQFHPVIWDAETEDSLVFPSLAALRSHL